jgi:hypothetical protein
MLLPKKMFIRLADFPGRKWYTLEGWIQRQQEDYQRASSDGTVGRLIPSGQYLLQRQPRRQRPLAP